MAIERVLERSIDRVAAWVEARDYRGYDPGDGLNSCLRPLALGNPLLERVLLQFVWKAPINVRPLIGIRPADSTKGRGYMAAGYGTLHRLTGNAAHKQKAVACLDWLVANRAKDHAGYAWGNHFDFVTRRGCLPAGTPIVVWTALIGLAFLAACDEMGDETGDDRWLDVVRGVALWILSVPRETTATGTCLSYVPFAQSSIHNSNMLGAAMLASAWQRLRDPELLEVTKSAMLYSCARQREDGAWWYGEEPKYHWIDSFHTGYNLDALKRYIDATGDETLRPHLRRGLAYFKTVFFKEDGRPAYYHNRLHPIDIQCAAQAIETLAFCSSEDPSCVDLAVKVAKWTINNMQDREGFFYFRQYSLIKSKTPYIHWGQATMFKALVTLLEKTLEQRTPPMTHEGMRLTYVLITPARNEREHIGACIRSVIAQELQPLRWIIVSDGSTDGTDEIVRGAMQEVPWIELLRMSEHRDRSFAAKAACFNTAYQQLQPLDFDLIGNLDADITFESDYYRFLVAKFASDPRLGVAGTPFVEDATRPDAHSYAHRFADTRHVSGACQMFRRACFEEVGGYKPIKGGGIDWVAVTTARARGWNTRTFVDKTCRHHRKMGTAGRGPVSARFRHGKEDYALGGHPAWQLARGLFQMRHSPLVFGGVSLIAGYYWAMMAGTRRPISQDLIAFHRAEQMERLRAMLLQAIPFCKRARARVHRTSSSM